MKKIAMKGMVALMTVWLLGFVACQNGSDDDEPTAAESATEAALAANEEKVATSGTSADAAESDGESGTAPVASEKAASSGDGDESGASTENAEAAVVKSAGLVVQREVTERNGVAIGDVILRDGSRVEKAKLSAETVTEDNPAVAVVAYFVEGGYVAVGMPSEAAVAWASDSGSENTKKASALACKPEKSQDGMTYTFNNVIDDIDSTDGSDNLQRLCDIDAEGTQSLDINYCAFSYAESYAQRYSLSSYTSDNWYLPSIAELYEVCMNRDAINQSLAICELSLLEEMYWSSSLMQTTRGATNSSWYLNFKTATKPYYTVYYEGKSKEHFVLPIRVFTDDSTN